MPMENATAALEPEERQVIEIQTAMDELDEGKGVSHEEISGWLQSWGTADETKVPR
ncbi:MAG: hypothetical protein ACRD4O_11670 [Bryobacteraceae bacterium]